MARIENGVVKDDEKLTAADNVLVVFQINKHIFTPQKGGPKFAVSGPSYVNLADGLKNEAFSYQVMAGLLLNKDKTIAEIRLMPDRYLPKLADTELTTQIVGKWRFKDYKHTDAYKIEYKTEFEIHFSKDGKYVEYWGTVGGKGKSTFSGTWKIEGDKLVFSDMRAARPMERCIVWLNPGSFIMGYGIRDDRLILRRVPS